MGTRQIIFLATILLSASSTYADSNKSARFEQANIDQYIENCEQSLALNGRTFDPFGKPLDPNKKIEIQKPKALAVASKPRVQRILIENEINKLARKASILGNSMIIEGQPYRRGDTVKVKVKGKTFPLKITSITRSKVTFYDAADKNLIPLDMNDLPDLLPSTTEGIELEGKQKTHDLK